MKFGFRLKKNFHKITQSCHLTGDHVQVLKQRQPLNGYLCHSGRALVECMVQLKPTKLTHTRTVRLTCLKARSPMLEILIFVPVMPPRLRRRVSKSKHGVGKRAAVRCFPLNSVDREDRLLQTPSLTLRWLTDWLTDQTLRIFFLSERGAVSLRQLHRRSKPPICRFDKWVMKAVENEGNTAEYVSF